MSKETPEYYLLTQQLRCRGVEHPALLAAMMQLPRDQFLPEAFAKAAYADIGVDLGEGRGLLTPWETAIAIQSLVIKPRESVLVLGSATGYEAALIAALGAEVTNFVSDNQALHDVQAQMARFGLDTVTSTVQGYPGCLSGLGHYDAIALFGALPELPEALKLALKPGGRLFAIVGEAPVMQGRCWHRGRHNTWECVTLFETNRPYLLGASPASEFQL